MKHPNSQIAVELVFIVLFVLVVALVLYFGFDHLSGGLLSQIAQGG